MHTRRIIRQLEVVGKDITEINNASSTNIAEGGASAQANIGDIITYQVPVLAVVPDAGLTQLGITDTMSKGLTFQKADATAASNGCGRIYWH